MPYEFTADDFTKFTDDILKAEGGHHCAKS